jgi:hypothetical protein
MLYNIAHPQGSGDRDAEITVTTNGVVGGGSGVISAMVDGSVSTALNTGSIYWNNSQTNIYVRFDFGVPRWIGAAFLKKEPAGASDGTWKWQGSNDAVAWTDILTGIALGTVEEERHDLSANSEAFRYYQLLQTAGTTSTSSWYKEMLFAIDSGA